jgi:hypothetical protein
MNTAENLSPAEQLLSLTREMLHMAKAGEWEKLAELEKTRLPIFEQVFAQGIAGNVELAKEVLSIDEQTKSLAQAEMPVVQDELLKMKNSSKANAAYQTIQGYSSSNK